MTKKTTAYETFLEEHLPKVPDFVKEHAPKVDGNPVFSLGPPVKPTGERDFVDFYLNGDVRQLVADIHARPAHYTQEQKELVEALAAKKPLPQGVGRRELNELVMRLLEATDRREKREKVIQQAQKALEPKSDDPTVERLLEEHKNQEMFENQGTLPKAIKII